MKKSSHSERISVYKGADPTGNTEVAGVASVAVIIADVTRCRKAAP